MQIVIGIEVNSEAYFPKLWEYCPSAEGTRAIFPQPRDISLTMIDDDSHYFFVIPLIKMDTELEPIVNQVIKFKISTTE